jgi:hypothetical protein
MAIKLIWNIKERTLRNLNFERNLEFKTIKWKRRIRKNEKRTRKVETKKRTRLENWKI